MLAVARMDSFTRGVICGMRAAGLARAEIVLRVQKKDGKRPTLRAVDAVLARRRVEPGWHGMDSSVGGRRSTLTRAQASSVGCAQQQQLLQLVLAERGKAKGTFPYCKRRLPFPRAVSKETVRRTLLDADVAHQRRRSKTSVPKEFRLKRMAEAVLDHGRAWLTGAPEVLRCQVATLQVTSKLSCALRGHCCGQLSGSYPKCQGHLSCANNACAN